LAVLSCGDSVSSKVKDKNKIKMLLFHWRTCGARCPWRFFLLWRTQTCFIEMSYIELNFSLDIRQTNFYNAVLGRLPWRRSAGCCCCWWWRQRWRQRLSYLL